jgi:hypothetical protein
MRRLPEGTDRLAHKRAQRREYYARHQAIIKQRARLYRQKNAAKVDARNKRYRAKNRDKVRAMYKAWRNRPEVKSALKKYLRIYWSDPSRRIIYIIRGARARAKKRGIPFDDEIREVLTNPAPTVCECCNRPFDYTHRNKNRGASPSIDKINNRLGYVVGNVAIICWRCNNLKRDATAQELRMVADWMDSKEPKHVAAA